jgi:putative nucleotidyltransferase with HDIG domain
VDRLAYLVPAHEDASWMVARTAVGLPDRLLERVRVHAAGELASLLKGAAAPVRVDRLGQVPGLRLDLGLLAAGGFTSAIPLVVRSELAAVVLLGETRTGGAPSDEHLRLGQFLASALVPLLAARARWDREREMSRQTLGVLITQLEGSNAYLKGHSVRVSRLTEQIALRLGICGEDLSLLTTAGLFHDLGRFEADLSLWSKPGPLSASDWQAVQRHPEDGARLLAEAAWPARMQRAVLHHHENWDGSGYPRGIGGVEIPLDARVLAVADALDALTTPRPYRPARSQTEAVRILRSQAGVKYDPELVKLVVDESQARA